MWERSAVRQREQPAYVISPEIGIWGLNALLLLTGSRASIGCWACGVARERFLGGMGKANNFVVWHLCTRN